jgi:uncharacterized glyoxalase superfamily protein PhnB
MKKPPERWPRISSAVFYEDAAKAIDWLCRAFGFEVRLKVEGEGGRIEHSELIFGEGLIMVGTAGGKSGRPERSFCVSPRSVGGANTQSLCRRGDDGDGACAWRSLRERDISITSRRGGRSGPSQPSSAAIVVRSLTTVTPEAVGAAGESSALQSVSPERRSSSDFMPDSVRESRNPRATSVRSPSTRRPPAVDVALQVRSSWIWSLMSRRHWVDEAPIW